MSKVSAIGVNGVSRSSGVRPNIGSGGSPIGSISIHEKFDFPEIDLPERDAANVVAADRPYRNELVELFFEILQSGVDIVPTKPRDHGGYIVEASFSPKKSQNAHPVILVPLRGVQDGLVAPLDGNITSGVRFVVTNYIDCIVDASTDEDLLRLLIVISHEFGHYISFVRGFHDRELQIGLRLISTKAASAENIEYTWLVFREESTAWAHAREVLSRINFIDWAIFDKVKNNSLATYLSMLKLEKASLDIYFKLSLLGDDFFNNCKSDFFQKLA